MILFLHHWWQDQISYSAPTQMRPYSLLGRLMALLTNVKHSSLLALVMRDFVQEKVLWHWHLENWSFQPPKKARSREDIISIYNEISGRWTFIFYLKNTTGFWWHSQLTIRCYFINSPFIYLFCKILLRNISQTSSKHRYVFAIFTNRIKLRFEGLFW